MSLCSGSRVNAHVYQIVHVLECYIERFHLFDAVLQSFLCIEITTQALIFNEKSY